jgi:catechol 2,3-dioxygenase-like lactoylglutathione lyase family enzyme
MPEIIGIDHLYITASNLERSEKFYDVVMEILDFQKNRFQFGAEQHIQYYNRDFGFVLRPARVSDPHNPYAPGLHHVCLRVESEKELQEVASRLKAKNISASEPRHYPEYALDYYAVYFTDPDGIRLEITNYRQERRQRHDNWGKNNS